MSRFPGASLWAAGNGPNGTCRDRSRHHFAWFVGCVAVAACAQPPTHEVALAEGRVARARAAEASTYSPELLLEAEEALRTARDALGARRLFPAAVRAAARAALAGDEALKRSLETRKRTFLEADRVVQEVDSLLQEARYLDAENRDGESFRSYDEQLQAIRDELAAGNALSARKQGRFVKQELLDILRSLK